MRAYREFTTNFTLILRIQNDFAYHETATYRSFEYSNQLNIRKTIVPICTTTTKQHQYLGNLGRGLTNKLVVELGPRAVGWAG